MKITYYIELVDGFRKPMETEKTTDLEVTISATCRVEADRAIRALVNPDNIANIWGVSIDD